MTFDSPKHKEIVLNMVKSVEIKGTMAECVLMIADLKSLQDSAEKATIVPCEDESLVGRE